MRAVRMSSTLPLLLGLALAGSIQAPRASAQEAVVRAVLFYSPTCPHCHEVMTEVLPPLADQYGDQLVIIGVDVTSRGGQALFRATVDHFGIPGSEAGVPLLVAGDEFMMGAVEIPERFPGIITRALAEDGVEWPTVGAIREALAAQGLLDEPTPDPAEAPDSAEAPAEREEPTAAPAAAEPTIEEAPAPGAAADEVDAAPDTGAAVTAEARSAEPDAPEPEAPRATHEEAAPALDSTPTGIVGSLTPSAGEGGRPSVVERLLRDPMGNGVALLVLAGLLLSLGLSVRLARAPTERRTSVPSWLVPLLAAAGIGVAAYLSFVEVTGQSAVCGPVGDCNAVQQSPYARLFGVLPVGVLGLFGYAAILAAWMLGRSGPRSVRESALRFRWAMAFAATAFSVYLTFLEPFVIGATCMWCITSSVVIALLLLVTTMELRGPANA